MSEWNGKKSGYHRLRHLCQLTRSDIDIAYAVHHIKFSLTSFFKYISHSSIPPSSAGKLLDLADTDTVVYTYLATMQQRMTAEERGGITLPGETKNLASIDRGPPQTNMPAYPVNPDAHPARDTMVQCGSGPGGV